MNNELIRRRERKRDGRKKFMFSGVAKLKTLNDLHDFLIYF